MKTTRVTIPTEWSAVTIKNYTEYLRLHSGEYDVINRITNTVSVIGGISIEDAKDISIDSLKQFYAAIDWMKNAYTGKDISSLVNKKGNIEIVINGKAYTCEPNVSQWTAGQYADIKTVLADTEGYIYNTDKILACVLYPKGEKYGKTSNVDKEQDIYNYMNMDTAFTLSVFFYQIYSNLIMDMLHSLNETVQEQTRDLLEQISMSHTSITGGGLLV